MVLRPRAGAWSSGNKHCAAPLAWLRQSSGRGPGLFVAGACVETQAKAREPNSDNNRPAERGPARTETGKDERRPDQAPKLSLRDRVRQHWLLVSAAACVILLLFTAGLLYWLDVRHYESTDDAFVAARNFSIAPKVGGYVAEIPVTDNQHVTAGQLLARIDERDYNIAVEQAQAQVAAAKANVANISAQIDSQKAQIDQARAALDQAEAQL
jgi:membrane fusion protein (multidrug efflux system)